MTIRSFVDSLPLVDNHAHAIMPLPGDLTAETYAGYFTEGEASVHARHSMFYYNALQFLSDYFGADDESTLVRRRAAVDHATFARELFERSNVSHIFQDTGVPPGSDTTDLAPHTDADVRPVLRIETAAEELLASADDFAAFETAFSRTLADALDGDHVALKSIVAYRVGLGLTDPSRTEAEAAYRAVAGDWTGRLEDPTLCSYLAHRAADVAADRGVPFQFHTGFGDRDAHPRFVDPSYLWEFLNVHEDTTVVLLHASYPYARVAGYLVSVLEHVYLDVGMTVPFVQHGVEPLLRQLLELAPSTKLLYSSDGIIVPEWHLLAARRMRSALGGVLDELCRDGFLTEPQAETVATNVLRANAERIYPI